MLTVGTYQMHSFVQTLQKARAVLAEPLKLAGSGLVSYADEQMAVRGKDARRKAGARNVAKLTATGLHTKRHVGRPGQPRWQVCCRQVSCRGQGKCEQCKESLDGTIGTDNGLTRKDTLSRALADVSYERREPLLKWRSGGSAGRANIIKSH